MKNQFYVSKYRFHISNDNIVGFLGFFREQSKGEEHIVAFLDRKAVECKVQEWEFKKPVSAVGKKPEIVTQHCAWVKLPKGWESGKKLVIVQCNAQEKKIVKTVTVKQLRKVQKEIPYNVDIMAQSEKGYAVCGWYLSEETADITFESKGRELAFEVKSMLRSDVRKDFPEYHGSGIHGFMAITKEDVPSEMMMTIRVGEKQSTRILSTNKRSVRNLIGKAGDLSKRAEIYYHRHGLGDTVRKIKEKIESRGEIRKDDYALWFRMNQPSKQTLQAQREERFAYAPKISIVVPLYKTPENYLREMIESVIGQTYSSWELCLSDGSGAESPIIGILKEYERKDKRIRVVYTGEQLHISENTNQALEIASGEYIAFADHDDLLMPNALYECVKALNENPNAELIYSDEDKVTMDGKEPFGPHFKSDFNPDMILGTNYICHLCVVKKSLYDEIGGLNSEFDGAQDYDFVLRATEHIEDYGNIVHIPKILYHWRAHKDSTAGNPESKDYAYEAGKRAVEAHVKRMGINGEVYHTEHKGFYRLKRQVEGAPLVSVVIPTKDHIDNLETCLRSLEEVNTYDNLEYIIVENNSEKEETFRYYEKIQKEMPRAKVVYWEEKGFNYSAINNFGVKHASGEYLLFLNNDTEIINPDCIQELLSQCQRPEVGAVGARLYYEDGTIQHAGVICGLGGVAAHAFSGYMPEDPGYMSRIILIQDYSAVTAACLMMPKRVFEEIGQFDEKYAVTFNDVDLCMRIRKAGYLIVYNPYAELKHYESKSRGFDDTDEKVQRFSNEIDKFKLQWGDELLKGDPYYNPNLTLTDTDFTYNFNV